MLPKDEIKIQAHAFVTFVAKRDNRGIVVHRLFLHWSASKDFTAEESLAIWQVVQASLPRAHERDFPAGSLADLGRSGC